jgi:transcriptional regulator with XRE-family HTH domain
MGRVLKLRIVARNGSVAYVVLPRNVDPVDAANVLTGGSQIGKTEWQPGAWLDTEGGGRIRADVIEQVYVEDTDAPAKKGGRLSKKAAALAATGLVTGAVGVPVHVAQAMIDNNMQGPGGQPTIVLVQREQPSNTDATPKEKPSTSDVDLIRYLRQRLNDEEARKSAFADTIDRLLGVHRLTAVQAAPLLGVSRATLSHWRNARRAPDVDSLMRLSRFFEIDSWELLFRPFPELLPVVADPERFERVERRIAEGAAPARLTERTPASAEPVREAGTVTADLLDRRARKTLLRETERSPTE